MSTGDHANETTTMRIDDHLRLDPLTIDDAAGLFAVIDRERAYLGRWLPFVETTRELGDTLRFVTMVVEAAPASGDRVFVLRMDGELAGLVGFKGTDRDNRRTEIGYWLSEGFQGRGAVTRSVAALLDLAFSDLGMHRVQIKCAVGNEPSKRIPVRLGFVLEGVERDGELLSGDVYTDLHVYSLLEHDWDGMLA